MTQISSENLDETSLSFIHIQAVVCWWITILQSSVHFFEVCSPSILSNGSKVCTRDKTLAPVLFLKLVEKGVSSDPT